MSIVLITPASEWVAGATVQFTFDCYAYEQSRYLNFDPYFGLWQYVWQYFTGLIVQEHRWIKELKEMLKVLDKS